MNLLRSALLFPAHLGEVFAPANTRAPLTEKSVLDFTMKTIDGKEVPLSTYRGDVILIVNVASKCGFTPQYEGLEQLYKRFKEQGFMILGFPENDFMGQEPGTDEEIKTFCTTKYGVTFDMFSKISVIGKNKHPLYRFLTEKSTNPRFAGEIEWNFQKFLIGRDGEVIGRFSPKTKPMSDELVKAVTAALAGA